MCFSTHWSNSQKNVFLTCFPARNCGSKLFQHLLRLKAIRCCTSVVLCRVLIWYVGLLCRSLSAVEWSERKWYLDITMVREERFARCGAAVFFSETVSSLNRFYNILTLSVMPMLVIYAKQMVCVAHSKHQSKKWEGKKILVSNVAFWVRCTFVASNESKTDIYLLVILTGVSLRNAYVGHVSCSGCSRFTLLSFSIQSPPSLSNVSISRICFTSFLHHLLWSFLDSILFAVQYAVLHRQKSPYGDEPICIGDADTGMCETHSVSQKMVAHFLQVENPHTAT